MIKKIEDLDKEKKREIKVKTPPGEIPKKILRKTPRGRQENYFFPKEMKTIRASSLEEATKKLKEGK